MAEIIEINDNTWRFEDDSVRFFLLCGNERAALVDTGMNTPNAREMAEKLTDLLIDALFPRHAVEAVTRESSLVRAVELLEICLNAVLPRLSGRRRSSSPCSRRCRRSAASSGPI